jgi:hypothetical protein
VGDTTEATGCRNAAIATALLLGLAVVNMVIGLNLANSAECVGLCQTIGLTLLYAGGPISGILGVFFGGIWVAWPLEITLWVVVGFTTARYAQRHDRRVLGVSVAVVFMALIYGLVLSQFVEIAV